WEDLPAQIQEAILYGKGDSVTVKYRNRYGRDRSYTTGYEGAVAFIQRRHLEADTDTSRDRFAGYMREVPCLDCHGARLKPLSLAVTIAEHSIAQIAAMPIGACLEFLSALSLSERDLVIAERVLKEVNERLAFLVDVGLHYLTLDRAAGTLAGGEA
ncbi:MAG TPA: excinuclease ABC subunit A, partial [Actinobacteria bacterium]|nr:excinuclease ABC subunit A [Actinomycetota bacterium]